MTDDCDVVQKKDEEDDDLYTEALNDNDNYDSSSDVEIWPAESLNDNYNYDCSSDVEIRPAELINDTSPEIEVEVEAKEEFNCPDLP